MANPQRELIWSGRIHLGDDPGVYGDAAYAGLCTEFPVTLTKFATAEDDIEFILNTAEAQVYDPYPGHKVTVIGYKKLAESEPPRWGEVELLIDRIKEDTVKLHLANTGDIKYISIRIRIDTAVAPGLYDEFLLLRLSLRSTTHYASLGFQAG